MFPPLDIPFEYWIEHIAFVLLYIMHRLFIMIFYRGVQALQLIVLAVFGAVDLLLTPCILVQFLEI